MRLMAMEKGMTVTIFQAGMGLTWVIVRPQVLDLVTPKE